MLVKQDPSIQQNQPLIRREEPSRLQKVSRQIGKIALPLIGIYALSNIPTATASLDAATKCIEECLKIPNWLTKALCLMGCRFSHG